MSEKDVRRAAEVAEGIAEEFGFPRTPEEYKQRLAYAYGLGAVDGYKEAASTAFSVYGGDPEALSDPGGGKDQL